MLGHCVEWGLRATSGCFVFLRFARTLELVLHGLVLLHRLVVCLPVGGCSSLSGRLKSLDCGCNIKSASQCLTDCCWLLAAYTAGLSIVYSLFAVVCTQCFCCFCLSRSTSRRAHSALGAGDDFVLRSDTKLHASTAI